jgi:hypothetical protein
MTDFLHAYGALISVVLVLLAIPMLFVFCRAFLSAESDSHNAVPRKGGPRSPEGVNR